MASVTTPDPTRCPLCGALNACAMELERATGEPQPPCWCTQVDFSAKLLSGLPPAMRGQACVCGACAGASAVSELDKRPSQAVYKRPLC